MQMWPLSNGDPKAKFTIKICSTSDSRNAIYANTEDKQHPEFTQRLAQMYEVEAEK